MGEEDTMSAMPGPGPSDAARVAAFLDVLRASTGELPISANLESRTRVIDERIAGAGLGLADKIAVFKALAPSAEEDIGHAGTGESAELRMERLLLSVAPEDLPAFKFALEYDLDYKDLEEYVFHDIDDVPRQLRILDHLKRRPASGGIKVLSDVGDTMYANLIDRRYPKGTFYPGVLDFYDAVKEELFATGTPPRIHITTLSARPNPVAGKLEEASLRSLVAKTKDRLCPSALSGSITSSTLGTIESILRARRRRRPENVEQLQGPDDDCLFDRATRGSDRTDAAAAFSVQYSRKPRVEPSGPGAPRRQAARRGGHRPVTRGTCAAPLLDNLIRAQPLTFRLPRLHPGIGSSAWPGTNGVDCSMTSPEDFEFLSRMEDLVGRPQNSHRQIPSRLIAVNTPCSSARGRSRVRMPTQAQQTDEARKRMKP